MENSSKLPRMIKNLWVYRRLVLILLLIGVALSFLLSNRESVKVTFPFLGEIDSTSGILMLVSALLGAAICWLVMTFRLALRDARGARTGLTRSAGTAGTDAGAEKEARGTGEPPKAGS